MPPKALSRCGHPGDDGGMRQLLAPTLTIAVALLAVLTPAGAQGPRNIRVAVEFRQTVEQSRDAVQGTVRPRAGVGVESADRRVRRSTGVFTLVQDGGESMMTVATQVPFQQVAVYRDYATGAGHLATGVVFQDVGTSLKVQAALLPGNQIRVRLTPRISYVAADGSGAIEFTEASTSLVVPSGRPVMLGGATSETHTVLRQILGLGRARTTGETAVVLTATVQ
jgi:Bacterial type II and III secretion system protein